MKRKQIKKLIVNAVQNLKINISNFLYVTKNTKPNHYFKNIKRSN